MGKRKKGRCAKKNINVLTEPEEIVSAPHSFVIHRGLPGDHIMELTKDFRRVMEPFTASSLKERKKNTIKDFVSIAGPLHVSHLSIFSRTDLGMYLKVLRLPRGPTLSFKVHNFSLARDVVSSLKKQSVVEAAFKHSPLIILNNFSGEGLQMKLMASMFQNMFPSINVVNVDLNTIKRCVLMNYNPDTKLIDFRHYVVKVIPVGISKGVKKVVQGKVPNLSRCNDISEFFAKAGMMSESEAEEDPQNHVTLPQKLVSRGNMQSGKSAIRLTELGPRLSLQLIKIEDGILDGEVLYHDLIEKTEEEKLEIQKLREAKKKLKEKRKKTQEENKKAKETAKEEHKQKSLDGMKKSEKGKTETDKKLKKTAREANEANPVEDDDDREYYKEEVGEDPDEDLFSSKPSTGIKRPKTFHNNFKQNKKRKLEEGSSLNKKFSGGKNKRDSFGKDAKKKPFAEKGNRTFKTKGKRKGVDKTNSKNRDFRPIGGKMKKGGKRKK